MLDPKNISKIGIGTWGIGGYMERDNSIDEGKQIDAIAYMISKGLNIAEANIWYSQGYSAEILAKAIKKSQKKREELFICQAIYLKEGKNFQESKKEVSQIFDLLETDYVDTIQFSGGSFQRASFEEITDWIDELLESKKTRYTSITNANLPLLEKYHAKYKEKFFSNEVVFNFEIRVNEELGIIPFNQKNEIKTVVYRPLRQNKTALRNWEPIVNLSKKYGKTQNQIILNWIVSKGYLPLTKSETIAHIDEHLNALKFTMEQSDIKLLNNFKIPNYTSPKIDWDNSGVGVAIVQLANVFDEIYDKQIQNLKH